MRGVFVRTFVLRLLMFCNVYAVTHVISVIVASLAISGMLNIMLFKMDRSVYKESE